MKLLTITTLFPYDNNPKHGIFVETRLRHLQKQYPNVEIKVIAPIPYFPFSNKMFGHYAEFNKAPMVEERYGMQVYHPRYLVIPKIGMTITPITLEKAIYQQAKKLLADGYDFDLIDGHYFYPDGIAIANVAKKLNKPFTVTARGTDINLIPEFDKPKRQIQQVLQDSNHNIAVCEALRQEMIKLGAEPTTVTTLRNGVDLELFSFSDETQQHQLREQLNLPIDNPVIISVGHLIERKGHNLVIEALSHLPKLTLLIAGDGPEQKSLQQLVQKLNLGSRVIFLGSISQSQLAEYYGACDLMVLASSREGWANVLLEAMACGTPVVATNIWGTPEVVKTESAGVLVERNPVDIAQKVQLVLDKKLARLDTRKYAETFSWQDTIDNKKQLIDSVIAEHY